MCVYLCTLGFKFSSSREGYIREFHGGFEFLELFLRVVGLISKCRILATVCVTSVNGALETLSIGQAFS